MDESGEKGAGAQKHPLLKDYPDGEQQQGRVAAEEEDDSGNAGLLTSVKKDSDISDVTEDRANTCPDTLSTNEDTLNTDRDTSSTNERSALISGDMHHANRNGEVVRRHGEVDGKLSEVESLSSPVSAQMRVQPHDVHSSSHRVCLEEYAPSTSSAAVKADWRMSLDLFSSKRWNEGKGKKKNVSRQVRRYYKTQDELITAFEEMRLNVDDVMETADTQVQLARKAAILAKLSFFCNLLLLIAKAVAAGMSGSLAVVSSVVDSAVDLVSGAIMWWSGRAMKRRNIYQYPQGRTKLEPIAIIILAVVMSLASIQLIRESVEKIISYAMDHGDGPVFDITSIVISCATVVLKVILFLLCRRVKTPSAEALAQDHRNDSFSNTVAVTCGILGDRVLSYLDPVGAILISLYILVSWYRTGAEQIKMLTGHTAQPDFMKKITWLALNHHPSIQFIDTVRAFHFGNNFLVECDIVLPEDMDLKTSHDIGESLQIKLERLPEVERAFVHLDYETDHSPYSEHKQV